MNQLAEKTEKLYFIDLFAGAGGLSEGFIQAGFYPIAHVEMNEFAAKTLVTRSAYYYLRQAGKLSKYYDYMDGRISREALLEQIPKSVQNTVLCETMSDESLPAICKKIDGIMKIRGINKVDVIIGGPPCQAYSLVGRAQSKHMEVPMSQDPRNKLYILYGRMLKKYKPRMFVFENVMGIESANGGATWKNLKKYLRRVGYEIECQEQNAKSFGVLQNRRRMIIIGWLKDSGLSYPEFTVAETNAVVSDLEYEAITHFDDPRYESNKKHFKAEEEPLPGYLLKYFSRIIRITRLREVRVLLGFTRVDAPDPDADADEQPNIVRLSKGRTERWLPAAEVNGEGIFIEFSKETIDNWLTSDAVKTISQRYEDSYRAFCESKGWKVTATRDAAYVLMHTFAHLLIKQMSMSSGYSSSAIRERIYFGEKMHGILLYTGSSDKEGSLGGLVELGTIDSMTHLIRDAFQEALVCTNDPECMTNMPAGKNSNGAACHSCCMISETACENGNRMLDRGLVVPIPGREPCSYFREMVNALCQVEI